MTFFPVGGPARPLLIILSAIYFNAFSQSPCEARDRNALEAIYNTLDGPNWVNNTNWNTAAPLNTWYGVSTDINGCVIEVDLNDTNTPAGGNGVSGTLPDELGNLLKLQFLDLTFQDISGPLPATLGNLGDLIWMEFDGNRITGTIPGTFGYLSNLELLNIRSNNLSGPLPDELGNLTSLKFLVLDDNRISGNLPESLGQLSNLGAMWLGENELTGPIPDSFSNLGSLYQFLLNENQLSGEIPDFWHNMPNMEGIWLNGNMLTGEIPQSIFHLNQLEQLLLNTNQLSGTISQDFQFLGSLRVLYLGENNFEGEIPPEFGNISTLEELGLYRTEVSGEIPRELGLLENLEILWLLGNDLTGTIPESLTQLQNLVQLNIAENRLTGTLPSDLNQIPGLTNLGIDNNLLEGPIPDFNGTSLDGFYFGNNQFQFGDFENQFDYYVDNLTYFEDNPQAKIDEIHTINGNLGGSITLTTQASGNQNHYQWFKDGTPIPNAPDSPTFTISNLHEDDAGIYYAEVSSDIVTDLVLVRNDITLTVGCAIPVADFLTDITTCESYVLPELSENNNYFTDADGGGTPLYEGNEITVTQTIFIYTGQGACSDETSFTVSIVEKPLVDSLSNVVKCEGYVLPTIENGRFFSEPGGNGITFFPGDSITVSQTMYIYEDNGACSDESFFTINIDASQCEVPPVKDVVLFPEFFTPNNDGSNDLWKVGTQEDVLQGYVYIYDRYGKLISQMDVAEGSWDGTYRGVDMPASTYWYKFDNSGTTTAHNGYFALIR